MKIVLHVGLPKSGTTSFQNYLVTGYSAPTDGTWYPPLGQTKRVPIQLLIGHALRDGDLSEFDARLKSFEGKADQLILSDENIYVEMPAVTKTTRLAFERIMARYDVTLLSVTRDKDAWMRSFYIQALELRASKAKSDQQTANSMWQTPLSFEAFFETPYAKQVCNSAQLLDVIAEVSKASSRINLQYEEHPDVVEGLRSALDLRIPTQPTGARSNPSLSDVQAEILRQANGQRPIDGRMIRALIAIDNGTQPRPKLREKLLLWRKTYDWDTLRHSHNAPLRYTQAEFEAKLKNLRAYAVDLT